VNKTYIPHQLQIQLIFEPTSNYIISLFISQLFKLDAKRIRKLDEARCTRTY